MSSASAAGRPKSRSGSVSVGKVKSGWIGFMVLVGEEGGEGSEAACARARVVIRWDVGWDVVEDASSAGGEGGLSPFSCGPSSFSL